MPTDKADELREVKDLWPLIEPLIGELTWTAAHMATDFAYALDGYHGGSMRSEMEAKFRKGEAEHGRGWLTMSEGDLQQEVQQELQDLVLYLCMMSLRFS